MTSIFTGLLLGTAAVASGAALEHQVRVDHASGATDVRYRGTVDVTHRQVGAIAPGGAPSSLRCHWRASIVVDREARHASGSSMLRTIEGRQVAEGSRPGWCSAQKESIRTEVAARTADLRDHLVAAAADDHPTLHAELDRLHGANRAG